MTAYNSTTLIIDDTDPRLAYSGTWSALTDTSGDYNGTYHQSRTLGDTIGLNFTGISIAVYGDIDSLTNQTQSAYYLDGSLIPTFTYIAPNVTTTSYNTLFFQSPTLPIGNHSLVIEAVSNGTSFWFDYILFTPGTSGSVTSNSSTSTLPPLPVISSTSTSTSTSPPSTSSPKPAPIGAAVGGSIGGVAALIIIAWVVVLWRRRNRNDPKAASPESPAPQEEKFTPGPTIGSGLSNEQLSSPMISNHVAYQLTPQRDDQ